MRNDEQPQVDSRLSQPAQHHVAVVNNAPVEGHPVAEGLNIVRCCDLHGITCEPPSELCCRYCTEVNHPAHQNVGCVLRSGDTGSRLSASEGGENRD